MPGLPGSSLEIDINMFKEIFGVISLDEIGKNHYKYVLKRPELQPDQLKIILVLLPTDTYKNLV